MISTWLFILIIGSGAQAFEVRTQQECVDLMQAVNAEIIKNETLKGKAATGCFRNLGIKANRS